MKRALLAAAVLAATLATAAAAQQQPPPPALRLASQTSWVTPGGDFVLRLVVLGDVDLADTELAVSVFRAVASRSEYALTLEDRIRGSAITVTPATPLAQLPPDAGGARNVHIPVQDPAQPADNGRLRLREPGVYPVRAELRRTGGGPVLARLVTHLVYATPPADGGQKLRFGLVVPFHAPPALRPDGVRQLPDRDRDRLVGLAAAVDAHREVPLTLKPTPETLQALASSPDDAARNAVATLARATTGRQVVGATYVPVPPTAFASLRSEATSQVQRGSQVLDQLLAAEPDPNLAVVEEHLDETALQQFRDQQVDHLVVPDPLLTPVDLDVTLAQPFELENREVRRPVALAADAGLAAHFSRGDDPALAAHHLLADLAVLYFDRPGRSRGVVALPPRSWSGDRSFLDTVLAGVASSPIVAGATVEAIFKDVPPITTGRRNDVLRRSPVPPPANVGPGALPAERIQNTRRRIRSFAAMLDTDNPRDDTVDEILLVGQSVDLDPRRRAAYLDGVDSLIAKELTLVRVPQDRSITLTARRGEIPITVLNEADYPVRLVVDVDSDKLAFPAGSTRSVELARRNTTEQFVVEARTSGAFPLRVRLTSPDGGLVVGETRFTVRSTAISGVGLVLSAGALLVLAAWWARHLVRGRRNRRLVPA
ncbi:MAG TPA: DUF6049 family protein [Acidimicrobiales bacterium]|nr:DUF6049 family protein [Acidimicrobiales bacterium]